MTKRWSFPGAVSPVQNHRRQNWFKRTAEQIPHIALDFRARQLPPVAARRVFFDQDFRDDLARGAVHL